MMMAVKSTLVQRKSFQTPKALKVWEYFKLSFKKKVVCTLCRASKAQHSSISAMHWTPEQKANICCLVWRHFMCVGFCLAPCTYIYCILNSLYSFSFTYFPAFVVRQLNESEIDWATTSPNTSLKQRLCCKCSAVFSQN